jgi:indolepyruvate ferredoxin oxidoreductase beta subunit
VILTMASQGNTAIFVVGLGGQGTIMFSKILATALLRGGLDLIVKETTGGTHRGSPVFSEIKCGQSGLAPGIGDGEADVVVGLEPLECLRYARKYSPKSTVLVNTHPVPPPLAISGKVYPPVKTIVNSLTELTGKVIQLNAVEIAQKECGHQAAANIIMMGYLTGLDVIKGLTEQNVRISVQDLAPTASKDMDMLAFNRGLAICKTH